MGGLNYFILIIVGLSVGVTLFYGIIDLAKKSFKPSNKPVVDSSDMIRDQHHRMQDIEQRQKDMKRQQDQKMKDLQRLQKR